MTGYRLGRPLVAAGLASGAIVLGMVAGPGTASARSPSVISSAPTQRPVPTLRLFTLRLTGRDAAAAMGNGPPGGGGPPGHGPPGGGGPPGQPPGPPGGGGPPGHGPPGGGGPPGQSPGPPATTVPATTVPAAPPPTLPLSLPPAIASPGTPQEGSPPIALGPTATAAPVPTWGSRGGSGTSAPPMETAPSPEVTSAPLVLTTSPAVVSSDLQVQAPRVLPDEPVPPPYAGNRSLVRMAIDSTGPIGRRPVIAAGVLIAMLIGIGAFRLEERTHLIRRIQDWRHFENM